MELFSVLSRQSFGKASPVILIGGYAVSARGFHVCRFNGLDLESEELKTLALKFVKIEVYEQILRRFKEGIELLKLVESDSRLQQSRALKCKAEPFYL